MHALLEQATTETLDYAAVFADLRDDDARRATINQELELLARALPQAEQNRTTFELDHAGEVIDVLRYRLENLGQQITELGGIPSTAENAIKIDRIEVWQQATRLIEEIQGTTTAYMTAARPLVEANQLPVLAAPAFNRDPASIARARSAPSPCRTDHVRQRRRLRSSRPVARQCPGPSRSPDW